jgi:hypothetical protein
VAHRAKEKRRKGISNKEEGWKNEEGRECSMLNAQYSMFNEE